MLGAFPSSRRFLFLVGPLVTVAAVGCAVGSASDPKAELDPSSPSASTPYAPDRGGPNFPEAAHEDAGAGVDHPTEPGPKDAGQVVTSGAPKPSPGEVLISEVMYDVSGTEP